VSCLLFLFSLPFFSFDTLFLVLLLSIKPPLFLPFLAPEMLEAVLKRGPKELVLQGIYFERTVDTATSTTLFENETWRWFVPLASELVTAFPLDERIQIAGARLVKYFLQEFRAYYANECSEFGIFDYFRSFHKSLAPKTRRDILRFCPKFRNVKLVHRSVGKNDKRNPSADSPRSHHSFMS
jgi:hypothetical protein